MEQIRIGASCRSDEMVLADPSIGVSSILCCDMDDGDRIHVRSAAWAQQ